ncbi:MAG: hypothetical protein AAF333_03350 [Planctomycetota bacterium]
MDWLKKLFVAAGLLAALTFGTGFVVGCEKSDDAADAIGDAADDAADAAGDAAEEAEGAVEDAANEAAGALEDATN